MWQEKLLVLRANFLAFIYNIFKKIIKNSKLHKCSEILFFYNFKFSLCFHFVFKF